MLHWHHYHVQCVNRGSWSQPIAVSSCHFLFFCSKDSSLFFFFFFSVPSCVYMQTILSSGVSTPHHWSSIDSNPFWGCPYHGILHLGPQHLPTSLLHGTPDSKSISLSLSPVVSSVYRCPLVLYFLIFLLLCLLQQLPPLLKYASVEVLLLLCPAAQKRACTLKKWLGEKT